jgi:hypothetical protein
MTNTNTNESTRQTATFETSKEAWAFMRKMDAQGVSAGYPSLKYPYTVEYLARS